MSDIRGMIIHGSYARAREDSPRFLRICSPEKVKEFHSLNNFNNQITIKGNYIKKTDIMTGQ